MPAAGSPRADQRLALAVAGQRDRDRGRRSARRSRPACSKIAYAAAARPRTSVANAVGSIRNPRSAQSRSVVLDQPLRPRDPPAAAGHLAAQDQRDREPECRTARPGRVAVAEVLVVGLLQGGGAVVVTTGEVGGDREPLEVLGVQRRLPVGRGQLVGRAGPRLRSNASRPRSRAVSVVPRPSTPGGSARSDGRVKRGAPRRAARPIVAA